MLKNNVLKILMLLTLILFVLNCTNDKDNILGYEDSEINLRVDTLDIVSNVYSYQDSIDNFHENFKLLVGNYSDITTFSLLKFGNFPDSLSESTISDTVEMKLYISHNESFENVNLNFAFLSQSWNENEANWLNSDNDTVWEENLLELNPFLTKEFTNSDSLSIQIPKEKIVEWTNNTDENHGLVIFTENAENQYLEFNSLEEVSSPELIFTYNDSLEYAKQPIKDTFIAKEYQPLTGLTENNFRIANLPNQNILLKLNEITHDSLEFVNTADDLIKTTINRAYLKVKKTEANVVDSTFTLYPYLLNEEINTENFTGIESNQLIAFTSLGSTKLTVESDKEDYVINLTSLIQSLTTQDHENFGIILKSPYRNMDYEFIEFDPENIKLEIIYTEYQEID